MVPVQIRFSTFFFRVFAIFGPQVAPKGEPGKWQRSGNAHVFGVFFPTLPSATAARVLNVVFFLQVVGGPPNQRGTKDTPRALVMVRPNNPPGTRCSDVGPLPYPRHCGEVRER